MWPKLERDREKEGPKLQGVRRRGPKLRKRPRFRRGLKLEGDLEGRNLKKEIEGCKKKRRELNARFRGDLGLGEKNARLRKR